MNLLRLLLIGLAVWIVIVLVRNARAGKRSTDQRHGKHAENMVECAKCGLHLPEGEAIREGDSYFCSEEHRDQA